MARFVAGLTQAHRLPSRPTCIPLSRPRNGSKRYGLRYERSVAERTNGQHGIWFSFYDANGPGYCQPDVLLGLEGQIVILECKLTEVDEARKQLAYLYVPVVSKALERPAKGIVVVRHLTRESDPSNVCTSLGEALKRASGTYYPTLHWIGRGPI